MLKNSEVTAIHCHILKCFYVVQEVIIKHAHIQIVLNQSDSSIKLVHSSESPLSLFNTKCQFLQSINFIRD